ncbi:Lar family restriction alleviation protein [Salmonella enterica]
MRHDNTEPCPFCDCTSLRIREMSGYYRAECCGCEATTAYQDSPEKALARWSERSPETKKRIAELNSQCNLLTTELRLTEVILRIEQEKLRRFDAVCGLAVRESGKPELIPETDY